MVYCVEVYGLGEDDYDFFDWCKENWVIIGYDVWIGYGVIVIVGVIIGMGVVVGVGVVVICDVVFYMVVGGVFVCFIKCCFIEM